MEPDGEPDTETDNGPDVVINVDTDSESDEPADTGDTVVVVVSEDSGDDGASDGDIDRAVDIERRFGELERRLDQVESIAIQAVVESMEPDVEIIDELPDTEPDSDTDGEPDSDEDEVVPENNHPWYRSMSDWFK